MPKWRKLHVKILESPDLAAMETDTCRLVWVFLSLIADREGRGRLNPSWLRSKILPLRDDVQVDELIGYMEFFNSRNMIDLYTVDGQKYFQICSWHKYQSTSSEAQSEYPSNPDKVETNSGVGLDKVKSCADPDVDVDVDVDKDVDKDVDVDDSCSDNTLEEQFSNLFTEKTGIESKPGDFKKLIAKGAGTADMLQAIRELANKEYTISKASGIVTPTIMVMNKGKNKEKDWREY
jgi:hypothetical protein